MKTKGISFFILSGCGKGRKEIQRNLVLVTSGYGKDR
jgi:hypothetical protein